MLEPHAGRTATATPGHEGLGEPGDARPGRPRPYGRLGGWVLARAHARSGDAAAISGYLGSGDQFDRAVWTFAEAYADQTEADWAAFSRARGSAPGDGGRDAGTNQRKGAEG